jgi:hypothetical protein
VPLWTHCQIWLREISTVAASSNWLLRPTAPRPHSQKERYWKPTLTLSRRQIWQWVHNGTMLDDGTVIDRDLVVKILDEELAKIRAEVGEETWEAGRPEETRRVFEAVSLEDEFPDFLTEIAYELLD